MTLTVVIVTSLALGHFQRAEFDVRVDPRIELLTTVFRLAGAGEYRMQSGESAYSKRVDTYFAKFKDHAAVKAAQRLREEYGVSFDAVPTLAVHLTDAISLGERIPFDMPPPRWDKRWSPDAARAFVNDLKAFVKDTDYAKFLAQEKPYYAKATAGMVDLLKRYPVGKWITDFYGYKPTREPFVIVGLLCGGGNYGMSVRFPDGSLEMSPVFGADDFDKDGVPRFGDGALSTVVHEFSHGYVNTLVDPYADRLKPTVAKYWPRMQSVFAANAYGETNAVLYETFVRAVESHVVEKHMSPPMAFDVLVGQRSTGFLWTSDLSAKLNAYDANRSQYKRFDQFMPTLVHEFERVTHDPETLYARCPKVLAVEPTWGPEEGDTKTVTIKTTFDQPMLRDRRGFSMEPSGWEVVKKTEFAADGKSMQLTLKVKKGTDYIVAINRFGRGVASEAGYPVLPWSGKLRS
ncbi:MAG: DUF4932 domain-containing protein [Armatimonadetes bacterium]|nr:DUF4932 domain-containing protein [Armatimonadota bacterium]